MGKMTTNELLRRYVSDRSDEAFAELVRQHIDLVYSAALRQVGGDTGAAQDVTQAVFTDLARKAPTLLRHSSITGWLYTGTRYQAAHARRNEERRRNYERKAHAMNEALQSIEADSCWQELRPVIDEAMHDLSAKDREAILLRFFEQLPLAEVGVRLGLAENTARMRVDRALDRLRAALTRRGINSTRAALGGVITANSVTAAPENVTARVCQAGLGLSAGGGFAWSFMKLLGVLKGPTTIVAGPVVLIAALLIVTPLLHRNGKGSANLTSEKLVQSSPPVAASAAPSNALVAGVPASNASHSGDSLFVLQVVSDETGKPIPNAKIDFIIADKSANGLLPPPIQLTANDDGVCKINIPHDTTGFLLIQSRTDGFVDTSAAWATRFGAIIPKGYTLSLETAVAIGGTVVDENGKPVSGAEVTLSSKDVAKPQNPDAFPRISTMAGEKTLTDTSGRWRLARFSKNAINSIIFGATHRDFQTNTSFSSPADDELAKQRMAGDYTYVLDHGVWVDGFVMDAAGQPVEGAAITACTDLRTTHSTSGNNGKFELAGCKIGPNTFQIEAQGFATFQTNFNISSSQTPIRLVLGRGHLFRLCIVDSGGLPVPHAQVWIDSVHEMFAIKASPNDAPTIAKPRLLEAGADGRISWEGAPEGEIRFDVRLDGFQDANNLTAAADGQEHVITLSRALKISGTVRDAATGSPVARFHIYTESLEPSRRALSRWAGVREFAAGKFSFIDQDDGSNLCFKIVADAYAPFVSRNITSGDTNTAFEVTLTPAAGITVAVLQPDGGPCTNAEVGLDMLAAPVIPRLGGLRHAPSGIYENVFFADNRGSFNVPADPEIRRVVVASPDGYAETTRAALAESPVVHLQPWGRIEGCFTSANQPASGRKIAPGVVSSSGIQLLLFDAETDSSGHFVFTNVPPGEFLICQKPLRGVGLTLLSKVTVQPGETTTLALTAYRLSARLKYPPEAESLADLKTRISIRAEGLLPKSVEFQKDSDGTWRAEDVPAGDYTVFASASETAAAGKPAKVRFRAKLPLTISAKSPNGIIDLGEITLLPAH